MPRITDQLVASEAAGMFSNHFALSDDTHLIRSEPHGHSFPGKVGWDAVAVAVRPHQAGTEDAQHLFDVAVERRCDGAQTWPFLCKAVSNRTAGFGRMFAPCQLPTTGRQPFIHRREA